MQADKSVLVVSLSLSYNGEMNLFLSWLKKPAVMAFLYCTLCILLGACYVLQGSIFFNADISRDFLLLDEIQQKLVVLIGPRASGLPGLFHGPLWLYLNYPAYILGQANPVAVGWFWIGLTVLFLFASYWLFKKISDTKTALIFCCMMAGMLIPWMYQYLNPFGALALIPVLVWSILSYQRSDKAGYFIVILLTLGACIQFQMAVGMPLTLLTFFWVGVHIQRKKLYRHLIFLPILSLPLLSFILFDLRHDFAQVRTVVSYLIDGIDVPRISLAERLDQRLNLATKSGLNIFSWSWYTQLNVVVFALILMQYLKGLVPLKKNDRQLFSLLTYLYLGFYAISLLFNGVLLIHYWWPLVPLSYGAVALLLARAPRKTGSLLLLLILGSHLMGGIQFAQESSKKIGRIEDDWKFQQKLAQKIFDGEEEEFGYFIFTPDIYAYETKAAMNYMMQKNPQKQVARYEKRPVTYLIVAPNPSTRPDILSSTWKRDKVRLVATPSATFSYHDGYVIEKYELSEEELVIPTEPNIDDWLHFR